MIKYMMDAHKTNSVGIGGLGYLFCLSNSLLLLKFCEWLKLKQNKKLYVCVIGATILLVFLQLYVLNAVISKGFYVSPNRLLFLIFLTVLLCLFGRAGLPYWDEKSDDKKQSK